MGALSESVIGKRSRALFMIVIFLVLLMVNAVFGVVIANSFVSQPNAVFPAWTAIVVALIIGQLLKRNFSLIPLCIVGIFVLYASVYAGSYIPLSLPETMFGLADKANWIIILFVYAALHLCFLFGCYCSLVISLTVCNCLLAYSYFTAPYFLLCRISRPLRLTCKLLLTRQVLFPCCSLPLPVVLCLVFTV